MSILVYNSQKDLKIDKGSARALVQATLSFLKIPFEEVCLYFVTQKQIGKLHEQFFQDRSPTDCISFPMDEKHLGEVFVCPLMAIAYADMRNGSPYWETALYIVHGLLHLIGYDDLEKNNKLTMRKKEKSCMDHLKRIKIALR